MYILPLRWRRLILATIVFLTCARFVTASDEPTLTKEQIKQFLLTAKVIKSEQAKKGITQTLRLTLSDGTVTHDASFQKIDEHKTTMQLASGTEVGFTSDKQLFQTGPGSDAVLERDAGMRWSYTYKRDDWAWAARELDAALPAGAKRMKLRLRSDRPGALFVQLEEASGETFFAMVEPRAEWTDVTLDLTSLKPDPAKRKDGILQPDKIVKLLLADSAARDKAEGKRNVWIARWSFE